MSANVLFVVAFVVRLQARTIIFDGTNLRPCTTRVEFTVTHFKDFYISVLQVLSALLTLLSRNAAEKRRTPPPMLLKTWRLSGDRELAIAA